MMMLRPNDNNNNNNNNNNKSNDLPKNGQPRVSLKETLPSGVNNNKNEEENPRRQRQDCIRSKYHPQPLIDHIQIANDSTTSISTSTDTIKILCFITTHSGYHKTRVQAVWKTWGPKCDKLIVSSNVTDQNVNALAIHSDGSYLGLWDKLNATLRHIQQTCSPLFVMAHCGSMLLVAHFT